MKIPAHMQRYLPGAAFTRAREWIHVLCLFLLLATTGCESPGKKPFIAQNFREHKSAYSTLTLGLVEFRCDYYGSDGKSPESRARFESNLATNLQRRLIASLKYRGFKVCETLLVAGSPDGVERLSTNQQALYKAADARIPKWRPKHENPTVSTNFNAWWTPLLNSNTTAVITFRTTACLETSGHRTNRKIWNWTGAPILTFAAFTFEVVGGGSAALPDLFAYSPISMKHEMILEEARTGQLLWYHEMSFPKQDVTKDGSLESTFNSFLDSFP